MQPYGRVLACVVYLQLGLSPCLATEYLSASDENPQQVDVNAWHFVVQVGVRPVGAVEYASSEYDFAYPTDGIAVDYQFNGAGIDFADDRPFYAIAPTLFDPINGYTHGWDAGDLRDGTFSGIVYSTTPVTAVRFYIAAEQLVPIHRLRAHTLSARFAHRPLR